VKPITFREACLFVSDITSSSGKIGRVRSLIARKIGQDMVPYYHALIHPHEVGAVDRAKIKLMGEFLIEVGSVLIRESNGRRE
jgi:hypothetical protein